MVQTANTVFRDFVTDGVPASGSNKPAKAAIREWGTRLENLYSAAQAGGGLAYETKAAMDADLAHAANQIAWVMEDPTAANNGIYAKVGASGSGSWNRLGDLPYSYIKASNAGAGTANAIVATTSIPIPAADGGALIALPIVAPNDASPVTVSFNGGSVLTVKDNTGSDIAVDGLQTGMIVAGYKSGTTFRLLSSQMTAALLAQITALKDAAEAAQAGAEAAETGAQNAQAGAETARDIAAGYASDAVSQGNVPIYATVVGMSAISVPAGINALRVNGYSAAGDGGAALYESVATEPAHPGKFQSADGVWWEVAEKTIRPEMFGGAADSDGTTGNGIDNLTPFNNMLSVATALTGVACELSRGIYRLSGETSKIDAGVPLTIRGQGAAQTYLYGDFVGAGGYILNLSNSGADSYSTRGHRISGIGFLGNGGPGDPQGLGMENSFEHVVFDIDAPNINGKVLCNSVIVVTRDNNSKFYNVRSQGGWQPSAVDISDTARASFTSGLTTVTFNESVITDAMVGATIFFSDGSASALNKVWSAQISSLNSASPSNSIEISVTAPATKADIVFGVGIVGGTISAGSNQLTLSGGIGIDDNYIGMQVHIPLASLKSDASNKKGLFSTRITAVNGNVLTLADAATAAVAGQPVVFAPCAFLGSFEGEDAARQTNHSWWVNTHFEGFDAFGLIVNRAIYTDFVNLKVHGTGFFGPDWVKCLGSILLSEIKQINIKNVQAAYGCLSKKIWIMGSRGVVILDDVEFSHIYLNTAPVHIEEVTDEFALIPTLIRPALGLDGFGTISYSLISAPAAHNVEYGVAFTRDQRLRQRSRNRALFTQGVTGQYQRIVINDDSAFTFRPPGNFGRVHITSSAAQVDGEVQYRTSEATAGVYAYLARDAGNMAVSNANTTLTGTTGTDGKVTIGPDASGNLQIENRRGFQIFIAFLVAPFGDG